MSLRAQYRPIDSAAALPANALAAVVFGDTAPAVDDARWIRVGLSPLRGSRLMELWSTDGEVRTGRDGDIRHASDGEYLFGSIELDERRDDGIAGAARAAYTAIRSFTAGSAHPHLLRMWNHFDDVNGGTGDAERYRQFCVGRAAGLGDWHRENYPAATAIGRRDGDPTLQVYWLSGREPGVALENPRQVNPWEYPRAYGPRSPQFSRGMRVGEELVLISGTASIVGHESHHEMDVKAQLEESLANLRNVLGQAGGVQLTERGVLRVYLRHEEHRDAVEERLREHLPPGLRYWVLVGDICRRDLLVEVEGAQERG